MNASVSSQYFDRVAGEWDKLRSGYFTEAVRQAAIRKAYLRSDFMVADVGAGTGFMTAGLAGLVRKVYLFDASEAMLDVARQNLQGFDNLVFQPANVLSLPLPDKSLDVVFANMVLHHCPDPLAAISEMTRVLRPGGRLVITDMDTHSYEWMKAEMADVWLGFERPQVRDWFQEAGLVNVIIDCTGENCCAKSQEPESGSSSDRLAEISTFVAVGTQRIEGVKEAVQTNYGALADGTACGCSSQVETSTDSACCSPEVKAAVETGSCCGAPDSFVSLDAVQVEEDLTGYSSEERSQAPEAADFSMGCGNPTAMAALKEGEIVLDIGSGGGFDAFLAARKVGPTGKVIGVDMTPSMLSRARRSAEKMGLTQVEFRQGQAEALPVENGSVDVIISNCVINLCEDKGQVFREAFRVLKDGGRLEVSDAVADGAFSMDQVSDPSGWPSCVFGALPEQEYLDLLAQAGFHDITVRRRTGATKAGDVNVYSLTVSAYKN